MKHRILISLLFASMSFAVNLQRELPTIEKAAIKNGIEVGSDNWFLLLAIRLQENGSSGREFGILNPKADNLDKQAGWCSATIIKHHRRFGSDEVSLEFIYSLANRYCPASCDKQGNENWKINVPKLFRELKNDTRNDSSGE